MNYKINSQGRVVILTIQGLLTKEDIPDINKCKNELFENETPFAVVLNFKNVGRIDLTVHRDLTLLQHEIRRVKSLVRVVGLNSRLRAILEEKGVLRGSEVGHDLQEVLKSLKIEDDKV